MAYNACMENRNAEIADKYANGSHSALLAEEYGISERQVQRIVNKLGVARTQSESYILAIKQGRKTYHRLAPHHKKQRKFISRRKRLYIMKKFKYTCQYCGRKPIDGFRLEIDHIDENPMNNDESNLQVLCSECNMGKSHLEMYGID